MPKRVAPSSKSSSLHAGWPTPHADRRAGRSRASQILDVVGAGTDFVRAGRAPCHENTEASDPPIEWKSLGASRRKRRIDHEDSACRRQSPPPHHRSH